MSEKTETDLNENVSEIERGSHGKGCAEVRRSVAVGVTSMMMVFMSVVVVMVM